MNEYISNPDEAKEYWGRYRLFYAILAFVFALFFLRLWYLQVMSGSELREFSEKNRIKQNKIAAPRGLILDRDGKVLVDNLPGFEAILNPQYITDRQALANSVGPILGIEPDKLVLKIQKSQRQNGPFAVIRLKENLSREEVFRLKRIRLDTPGLEIRESILRHYPLVEDGAQLFGYVGEISKRQLPLLNELYKNNIKFEQGDIIGKNGLEETLERDIRGTDGMSFIQVDAHGRETSSHSNHVYGEQIHDVEPIHGNNAVLTIDRDVQEAAFQSMRNLKRIGAAIAMKTNGEIIAWVNEPSFDPNIFAAGPPPAKIWSQLINDQFKPFRNKAIQDHASPGSTFKPLVALAALQEKVVTPTTLVHSPGVFYFGKRPYHDSHKEGHGYVTIIDAIERSANVFFFKMGIALGIDKMYSYIYPLGIGHKTGIEVGREVQGTMPNSEWKKHETGEEWQPGENLLTAIGQAFVRVSPIQMLVAYSAIATDGKVVQPFVVKKIIDQEGHIIRENSPKIVRDLTQTQETGIKINKEHFAIVREGMKRVTNGSRGTARQWKIPGVQFAGKTGTAQVMGFSASQIYDKCDSRPIHMRHHGWFVGFAPADNPEIAVAVLAEHSCGGSGGAGPVARDIIQAYFQKYHPEMIEAGLKNKNRAATPAPVIAPIAPAEDD